MITIRVANAASIFAASLMVAGAAVPANATATDPAREAKAAAKPASADPALDKRSYCLRDTFTGSRVARTVCKTRSEWIAINGTDPAKK